MITLCKKTLHTFLGLSPSPSPSPSPNNHTLTTSSPSAGGLILLSGECRKPPYVLESSAFKPCSIQDKKDPGRCGAVVHGLSSCTESLGFESSDQMEEMTPDFASSTGSGGKRRWRRSERLRWREEVRNRKLPPPLSSLNQNGQSTFFLRPVRENGRLVLTEVKISRPEIFRATRHDGRLRLEIAGTGSEIESEKEEEPEPIQEQEAVEAEGTAAVSNEEEERGRIWKIQATGGEGFRRCHEMRSHHHHNYLTLWNHQCVTTR